MRQSAKQGETVVDRSVLARIYLEAVLPCLETLTEADNEASRIASGWEGSIRFEVGLWGPRCLVDLRNGRARVSHGPAHKATIALFFPHPALLTNLFTGRQPALAIPRKGLFRLRDLAVFSRLAAHMQKVLEGQAGGRDLQARLMLGVMARSVAVLAVHDRDLSTAMSRLNGVAQFRIRQGPRAYVTFSESSAEAALGHAEAPDFTIEFSTSELFLAVADDAVDVMAKTCLGEISITGDIHMGQTMNTALDAVGAYLR